MMRVGRSWSALLPIICSIVIIIIITVALPCIIDAVQSLFHQRRFAAGGLASA
jgi:hypothetical protein